MLQETRIRWHFFLKFSKKIFFSLSSNVLNRSERDLTRSLQKSKKNWDIRTIIYTPKNCAQEESETFLRINKQIIFVSKSRGILTTIENCFITKYRNL